MEDALISIACQDKQQSVIVVCLYAEQMKETVLQHTLVLLISFN